MATKTKSKNRSKEASSSSSSSRSKAKTTPGEITTADIEATQSPVTQSDVDVADLDPKSRKGEVGPLILAGYWVILGGLTGDDERFNGALAAVTESPWTPAPIGVDNSGISGYSFDDSKDFVVQTRDASNALVSVKQDNFVSVGQSRSDVEHRG